MRLTIGNNGPTATVSEVRYQPRIPSPVNRPFFPVFNQDGPYFPKVDGHVPYTVIATYRNGYVAAALESWANTAEMRRRR